MLFNVPNLLTYARILLIPVLAALLAMIGPDNHESHNIAMSMWATVVFAIAGITDLFDGYFARRMKAVSNMGKFFDPMADKLIHMTAMVMLIPLGRIDVWLVVVLLFREIFISGLRAAAAGEGLIIAAAEWGKRKTAWLNIGIAGLIFYYPLFPQTDYEVNSFVVANFCMMVGFVYSIASGLSYTVQFLKIVKK